MVPRLLRVAPALLLACLLSACTSDAPTHPGSASGIALTSLPATTTTTLPPTTTFNPEVWPLGFDDPRGEAFADFQAAFDRGDRFQRLELFCQPG